MVTCHCRVFNIEQIIVDTNCQSYELLSLFRNDLHLEFIYYSHSVYTSTVIYGMKLDRRSGWGSSCHVHSTEYVSNFVRPYLI